MKGIVDIPQIYLECIHCGERIPMPTEEEVDIPVEYIPSIQDAEIRERGTNRLLKDGDTMPGICPDCIELGLPYPEDWEELDEGSESNLD